VTETDEIHRLIDAFENNTFTTGEFQNLTIVELAKLSAAQQRDALQTLSAHGHEDARKIAEEFRLCSATRRDLPDRADGLNRLLAAKRDYTFTSCLLLLVFQFGLLRLLSQVRRQVQIDKYRGRRSGLGRLALAFLGFLSQIFRPGLHSQNISGLRRSGHVPFFKLGPLTSHPRPWAPDRPIPPRSFNG
jgi:hypothetical protein